MTLATDATTTRPSIPQKSHFKLDEVCSLTGVKPYVLRFWESEFSEISPLVSSSGQKLYQHSDIDAIFKVKSYLFEKKWTIEQAKKEFLKVDEIESSDESDLPPLPGLPEASPIDYGAELNPWQMKKLLQAKRSLVALLLKAEQLKKRYQTMDITRH